MMLRRTLDWLCLLFALTVLASVQALAADDFLAPEQAFVLRADLVDAGTVRLHWQVAPGYHLYRERLGFASDPAAAGLGQPALPKGVRKFDENFNKEMETYAGELVVNLPLAASKPFVLNVAYQGCADAGLCYPPASQSFAVDPAQPGALRPVAQGAAPAAAASEDESSLAQRTLESGSLWRIGLAFLAFGLLLSFTPCVLPMVPILSSIVVGEAGVTRRRGLALAGAYSLGMALVYTALGVAAGLAGEGLAGALQKPWVLLGFGALLVALALSMFDVYQLQLPSSFQSRLSASSGKLHGGRYAGVFAMGALSALIVGPCVAAPLAGALLYISQTGNAWTGGWALFSMAAGMSVPLLLTGLSAGALLPRAGGWMNGVKKVFGVLLLAVAIWMVSPVIPAAVAMALWGSLAILSAVFLRVGEAVPGGAGVRAYAARALGLLLLLGGLFELVGAASAGRDVLQPLAHLRPGTSAAAQAQSGPRFARVRNVAELESILATTSQPVLLDFYADWCVACKEMEHLTFSDTRVAAALGKLTLLQADVTANNADDRALMKRFQLYGPPGIILFDARGKEVPQARVIGFMKPEPFLQRLQRASAG